MKEGLSDIITMIRKYLAEMASHLLVRGHAWGDIFRLLGTIDISHLDAVVVQSWQCVNARFEQHLGRYHKSTIECYLNFVDGAMSPVNAEAPLRELLASSERDFGLWGSRTLDVMANLGYSLCSQGRYQDTEGLGLDLITRARAVGSSPYQVHGLELTAYAQYRLDNRLLAEINLREAADIDRVRWGETDIERVMILIRLEGWLREWRRHLEADTVKASIEEAIEPDDIDKIL